MEALATIGDEEPVHRTCFGLELARVVSGDSQHGWWDVGVPEAACMPLMLPLLLVVLQVGSSQENSGGVCALRPILAHP